MFLQAFGFIISMITQLFSFVFGIQLSQNLTFGGVIAGMIIATFAYAMIMQFVNGAPTTNLSSLNRSRKGDKDV
jgi:hypothetical protein